MYWMKDGVMILFEEQLGILQYKRANLLSEQTVTFVPLKMQNFNKERAQDYFAIRESYFALTAFESEHYTEHPQHREQLNSNYDRFVQKWGFFHNNDNKEFIMLDSLGMEIYTIEIQIGDKIMKADIMNEPVAFKKIDSTVILSPTEALASSLNYYGRVPCLQSAASSRTIAWRASARWLHRYVPSNLPYWYKLLPFPRGRHSSSLLQSACVHRSGPYLHRGLLLRSRYRCRCCV